jgi:AhpD family alkylhydroperoxidase
MDLPPIPFEHSLTGRRIRREDEIGAGEGFTRCLHAMLELERFVSKSSKLELSLLELIIKMRASQINGCAFCLRMHSEDARVNGETEQRLYALSA